MPTITTVDTTWTNGVAMDEAELRRADSAMFLGDGSNNGVRGGIVRHGDNSLAVSVNGSDQVTVQAGAAVIPAATGLGVYRGVLSAATAATAIDPRNATNPRIDLVVFRSTGAVDIITGTPGASPSAPALPAQAVEVGRINVPAVSGGAATVDLTWRQYATALGGTIVVETAARLPGSGNQKVQRAVALDDGIGHTWDGTEWVKDGAWRAYTPAIAGFTTQAGSWFRWRRNGLTVKVQWSTKIASVGADFAIPLPLPAYLGTISGDAAVMRAVGAWHALDAGTARYTGTTITDAGALRFAINGTGAIVGTTNPFAWATGDPFSGEAEYETTA